MDCYSQLTIAYLAASQQRESLKRGGEDAYYQTNGFPTWAENVARLRRPAAAARAFFRRLGSGFGVIRQVHAS
jgi:hypothetical protein